MEKLMKLKYCSNSVMNPRMIDVVKTYNVAKIRTRGFFRQKIMSGGSILSNKGIRKFKVIFVRKLVFVKDR